MSREIGGTTLWGSAVWGRSTFSSSVPLTTLATRLLDDPDDSAGVLVGPDVACALRFVVEALNPTAGAGAKWGTAKWGTDVWADPVGQWEDISDRVRGLTWTLGATDPTGKAVVGGATLTLDNTDGEVSPWATTGDFVGGGSSSWIRSGLKVRFGMIVPGDGSSLTAAGLPDFTYEESGNYTPFFTGRVDAVDETTTENVDSAIALTLVETAADFVAPTTPFAVQQARELGSTILAVLQAADWPYQNSLVVPDEDATCMATTLDGDSTVGLLADGMHWDLACDGRGRLRVLRRRQSDDARARGINFSNDPEGAELPMVIATPYSSLERVTNQIEAARSGGALVAAQDNKSMAQFGAITTAFGFPRTDLVLETDDQVTFLLRRVVALRAWDDLGIGSINLNADMDPVRLPAVLAFYAGPGRFETSLGVRWVHPSGSVLDEACIIESQTHNITIEGSQLVWTATFTTGHAGVISG